MASYTTNLNLKKPAGSENVAIGDINNNMDTIDQAFGTLNSKIGKLDGSSAYASVDANDCTTTGIYHVGITSHSPTSGSAYGTLFVEATPGRISQMFNDYDNHMYIRQYTSNAGWNSWDQLALNSKIISGSKTITAESGATGSETIYLPYTDANYSVSVSIKYAANFTKAYPYYDRKYAGYVDVGFYNDHSSSLTLTVDYIISKY